MKISIVKDGWPIIKICLIMVLGSYVFSHYSRLFYIPLGLFLALTLFTFYFFRDPERKIVSDANVVLSPADGKIFEIVETPGAKKVKIFMSPLNVHVQRAPVDAAVKSATHKPGEFLHARDPKADEANEQNVIVIEDKKHNCEIEIKQIAGIIARRIVCWVKPGEEVKQGQKIGMIKFGSQVDITVPGAVALKVKEGDVVTAGITIIGVF